MVGTNQEFQLNYMSVQAEIVWFFVKTNFSFSNVESTPKLLNISIDFLSP